jgi:L-histidine Nalpha-methyltransferase
MLYCTREERTIMPRYTQQLNRIEEAIDKALPGWFLCFVGEDQSKMLAALTHDLRRRSSIDDEGKRISSGFSYWGTGPTMAWALACNDPFYLVMKESSESFPSRWAQILAHLDYSGYHYVSLGIGTGDKDRHILHDLYKANTRLFYFPVDMSLEMLRVGIQEAIKGVVLQKIS